MELADRITAHVWLFLEHRQEGESLLDASDRLAEAASSDYAVLQPMLDLAELADQEVTDPRYPLDWVQRKQPSFWRLWFAKKNLPLAEMDDKSQREIRQMAGDAALGVLVSRIEQLHVCWKESAAKFTLDAKGNLSEVPSGNSLTSYCSRATSDELFDNIALWLVELNLDHRIALAKAFVPQKTTPGELREPRFLLEKNLDGRARVILGWPRRLLQVERFTTGWRRYRLARLEAKLATQARYAHKKQFTKDASLRLVAAQWLQKPDADRLIVLLDRAKLRSQCRAMQAQVPFSIVMSDELEEITRSRVNRLSTAWRVGNSDISTKLNEKMENQWTSSGATIPDLPLKQAFKTSLLGLAFSGGGIRSATFSLGLIQGMADRNILPYIDLISSVSGGGYISSWLIAWTKRRGNIHSVQDSLRGNASPIGCTTGPDGSIRNTSTANLSDRRTVLQQIQKRAAAAPRLEGLPATNQDPQADHLRPVRLLRDYSRYLAPESGLFSADTWTIAATWLRNTLLNLSILMLLFGALLILPRIATILLYHGQALVSGAWSPMEAWAFSTAGIAFIGGTPYLLICLIIGVRNLDTFGCYFKHPDKLSRGDDDRVVLIWIVIPLLIAGFVEAGTIWDFRLETRPFSAAFGFSCITVCCIAILWSFSKNRSSTSDSKSRWIVSILIILFASVASYSLMVFLCDIIQRLEIDSLRGSWLVAIFGPSLMTVHVGLTVIALLGLGGRLLSDEQREWWSRLGAWMSLAILGWSTFCILAFFMPLWIQLTVKAVTAVGITWGAITLSGLKLAFSTKSVSPSADTSQAIWRRIVLGAAPIVFVFGLLSATSVLVFWCVVVLDSSLASYWPTSANIVLGAFCCSNLPMSASHQIDYYWLFQNGESLAPIVLGSLFMGLSWFLASRVDVNEFSMHHFYRNRLVRAYLGASRLRAHREPNAFTGFDLEDDVKLHRFQTMDETQVRDLATDCKSSYIGPFPILNTALNVTKGQDLGIQQRKAESFFFTPIWSGFDFMKKQTQVKQTALLEFGFRRTCEFGDGSCGTSLGTAMAISGAAASSNAGFHTSPPLAFLLTVFGVRLGWWAGNPRWETWGRDSPGNALTYLTSELAANTTTDRKFVLLTDGGHFENMGLYELIRRHCRYIILSDAEQDEKFKLEGIGGAVRKCRNDFGVVISLNLEALEPLGDPARSRLHYSIGSIKYPGEEECGVLLYIKASLTGDETVDLMEFGRRHKEFPHTSTANQFFDESHFESYRELGHHIASGIFKEDWPAKRLSSDQELGSVLVRMFKSIEQEWGKAMKQKQKGKPSPG
jgi:hypothetical protein